MITLLTGVPGAGKTATLVEWLRTLYTDRPLYVHGLEGLKLDHTPLDASRWHQDVPDGAIVVIDEVQDVWRPRGPGHAPSDAVKALETHRHRGIDFFVTTQKPNLVDANVRGLVGRHVHIRDTGWLGRWQYEWPECSENIAWKTCAVKKRFKLPKKAFELYKSSSMHTTVQKSRSLMPLIALGLCIAVAVLVLMVYRAISSHTAPKAAAPAPAASAVGEVVAAPRRAETSAPAPRWPVYDPGAVEPNREPYAGRALSLEGGYTVGRKVVAYFGIIVDGRRVASVSLDQLVRAGYSYTEVGPCSGVLRFRQLERAVTCAAAVEPVAPRGPDTPSSVLGSDQARKPLPVAS